MPGTDDLLEQAIRDLLDRRAATASICPSEAARAVAGDDEARWRPLMEPARAAAARLAAAGEVEVTQGGRVVDATTARGPVRIRRGHLRPRRPPPAAAVDRPGERADHVGHGRSGLRPRPVAARG